MTPAIDRALLAKLPKAELHCHLDGSVRPATLLELGHELSVEMPRRDADTLRRYMLVDDRQGLDDYLQRFSVTLSVMQTVDALERIAYELAEDAAADGVRYIEIRYAPVLNVRKGLALSDAVDAPLKGLARAERDHRIVGRVIVCAIRTMSPDVSLELAELAVAYRHRGVVAFDLAGNEAGYPASAHERAFAHARNHDLACTCHAGEGAGAESVREAVHTCGANRIGHATRLFEDRSLLEYVNDRRIALEICLTSNVQTHAAPSFAAHPVRQYFDQGLNVVLNTDNRLMSGTTLTDEFDRAATHLHFSLNELGRMALNGFESAFLPYSERQAMIKAAEAEMAALGVHPA